MNEGPDKQLQNEWNRKLAEAGLPENVKRQKIPLPAKPPMSATEILTALVPDIDKSLEKFATLPDKLQNDILVDLKKKRGNGMHPRQILDRFYILLAKGEELDKMTAADSDEIYNPKSEKGNLEKDEEQEIAEKVDNLIRRMEEEVSRPEDKGVDNHIN